MLINAEKKVPKVSNFPERACHAIKVNFLQLVTMARQRKHTSQVLRVFRWKTHMGGFHPPSPTPRRFLLLLLFFFSMFTVGRPPKGAAFPLSGLPLPRAVKDLPSYGRIKNRRRERPFPPFFLAQLPNQTYSKRSILLENNSHCSPPQFSRALRFLIGASESYTELIFCAIWVAWKKQKVGWDPSFAVFFFLLLHPLTTMRGEVGGITNRRQTGKEKEGKKKREEEAFSSVQSS